VVNRPVTTRWNLGEFINESPYLQSTDCDWQQLLGVISGWFGEWPKGFSTN
jgi:hypothetical protein